MEEELKQYIISLYHDVPQEIYEGLLSIFCLGAVLLIIWKGFKMGFRFSAALLLLEYIFLLFCSTVIFRPTGDTRQYDFYPFWSYNAIQEGREDLLTDNIMNVVVFIPVGLILSSLLKVKGSWLIALMTGLGISVTIEALQFWFMKGFSEVDDVIHNTVGCLMGFGFYSLIELSTRLKTE